MSWILEKTVQDLVWPRGQMRFQAVLGRNVDFGDSLGRGDHTRLRRTQARTWALGMVHRG